MSKFFISGVFILFSCGVTLGQVQLGFKVSPLISANRITSDNSGAIAESQGSGLRFSLGPVIDFMISNNESYYMSTGLWFTTKRVGIQVDNTDGISEQTYNLQYLSLPFTLKLKTQEIALDKRIYIQFGPTFDIAVSDKRKSGESSQPSIVDFSFGDVELLMGAGLEWHLGNSTRFSTGFSYSRGLANVAKRSIDISDLSVKNDLFSIDLIVMF